MTKLVALIAAVSITVAGWGIGYGPKASAAPAVEAVESGNCLILEWDNTTVVPNNMTVISQADPLIYFGILGHYLIIADGPFDIYGYAPNARSVDFNSIDSWTECR